MFDPAAGNARSPRRAEPRHHSAMPGTGPARWEAYQFSCFRGFGRGFPAWLTAGVRKKKMLVAFAAAFRVPPREASEFRAVAYPSALLENAAPVGAWVRVVRLEVFAVSARSFSAGCVVFFGPFSVESKKFRTSDYCQRAGRFRFGCHGLDWVDGVGVAAFPARGRPAMLAGESDMR